MFEKLKKEIQYAKSSLSARELLFQAYGSIKMAYELNALTKEEFLELNTLCIRDGINNPKFFKEGRVEFNGRRRI